MPAVNKRSNKNLINHSQKKPSPNKSNLEGLYNAGSPLEAASIQIPTDHDAPILIEFNTYALKMALIKKTGTLSQEWNQTGVYSLIGAIDADKPTVIYIGKATGLKSRIHNHKSKPPIDWQRALLVCRDTTNGFNSAEIGYLEGRWAGQVAPLPHLDLYRGKIDIDTTLPTNDMLSLDKFIPTLLAALKLTGVDLSLSREAEAERERDKKAKQKFYGVSIADLVAAGNLTVGQKLIYSLKGESKYATISSEGSLIFEGTSYESLSTAGGAAYPDVSPPNGWLAWKTLEGVPLYDVREEYQSDQK